MLKTLWYYLFNKKEKIMPVTDENVTAVANELQQNMKTQQESNSKLNLRVSTLTDDIAILKNDINNFKTAVSNEMKQIVAKLNEKK